MGLNFEDHLDEVLEVIKIHLLALLLIFVVLITKRQIKQTGYEQFAFYWYLFNGAIIHITWDGLIAALHHCEPVYRAYSLMDRRYKVNENMVYTVSLCELFLHGPLCLYTARLYLNSRGIRRDLLSFLSSFLQLIGTIYFVFDEYLNKFENVCPEESCFTFSPANIGFFWLCFVFFNPIWIIVPLYNMYVAYKNIAAQDKWTFQNCAIENRTGVNYYDAIDNKTERIGKAKKAKSE